MEEKKTTNAENTESTANPDTKPVSVEATADTTAADGVANQSPDNASPTSATASTSTPVTTPTDTTSTTTTTKSTTSTTTTAPASTGGAKQYGIALVIVLIFGVGLVYALEQQGRIDTNLFGWMQTDERSQPVATVNGVEITGAEFAQNRDQVIMSAEQQGVDTNDPEVTAEIDSQALEVLINTQLLRQAANNAGITASPEEIDARYQEIVQTVGGEETLVARMGELGITPESLRTDIEGELLVQALIDAEVDTSNITITEEEIVEFYEGAATGATELPPLEDVRTEIEQQLRAAQEQELVAEYIEALRAAADIEILI